MNERLCIRCQHPVLLEDGHLVFCSHCGAPQIFLSEEVQQQIADGARAYQERLASPPETPSPQGPVPARRAGLLEVRPGETPWSAGVRYALLSAAVVLALGILSLAVPPVGLLMLLWVMSAPILTVAFFQARSGPGVSQGSGFAARLGLLTGLLVIGCCAVIFTLSLVLTRFVFHDAALLDAQLAANFAQQRAALLARLGSEVQPTLDMFAVPEFRVGLLLTVTATSAAFYLFLSTLAGGITGMLVRGRRNS